MHKKDKYIFTVILLCVLLTIIATLFIALKLNDLKPVSNAKVEKSIHKKTGTVTRISGSCGDRYLDKDGAVKYGLGICDAGTYYIYVDGQAIQTAWGHGPMDVEGQYFFDTKNINPGDNVTITYAEDDDGNKDLNCTDCSISKN